MLVAMMLMMLMVMLGWSEGKRQVEEIMKNSSMAIVVAAVGAAVVVVVLFIVWGGRNVDGGSLASILITVGGDEVDVREVKEMITKGSVMCADNDYGERVEPIHSVVLVYRHFKIVDNQMKLPMGLIDVCIHCKKEKTPWMILVRGDMGDLGDRETAERRWRDFLVQQEGDRVDNKALHILFNDENVDNSSVFKAITTMMTRSRRAVREAYSLLFIGVGLYLLALSSFHHRLYLPAAGRMSYWSENAGILAQVAMLMSEQQMEAALLCFVWLVGSTICANGVKMMKETEKNFVRRRFYPFVSSQMLNAVFAVLLPIPIFVGLLPYALHAFSPYEFLVSVMVSEIITFLATYFDMIKVL